MVNNVNRILFMRFYLSKKVYGSLFKKSIWRRVKLTLFLTYYLIFKKAMCIFYRSRQDSKIQYKMLYTNNLILRFYFPLNWRNEDSKPFSFPNTTTNTLVFKYFRFFKYFRNWFYNPNYAHYVYSKLPIDLYKNDKELLLVSADSSAAVGLDVAKVKNYIHTEVCLLVIITSLSLLVSIYRQIIVCYINQFLV